MDHHWTAIFDRKWKTGDWAGYRERVEAAICGPIQDALCDDPDSLSGEDISKALVCAAEVLLNVLSKTLLRK
jgi:hypothetical protein